MNFEANTRTPHLTVYRGIALTTGFLALFISPFLQSVVTDLVDPMLPRYLIAVISTTYVVASFRSQWVVAHMQQLMIPLAYGTGAWLLYLAHLNDFVPALAYSVFEVLVGGSIVFTGLRSLGLFLTITCGATLLLVQHAGTSALDKQMYLSTLVIVAALIFLVSYLRHGLDKELRATARLMQSVFTDSADALLLLRKGEIIGISDRSLELFGLATTTQLSQSLQELIDNRSRFLERSEDVQLNTDNKGSVWVEVVVSQVAGDNLELMRLTDIGQRKRAELELTQAVTAAEKALSVRQDLLTTVSHELRTPLNGVIGSARLLAVDLKGSSALDLIHLIERSGNRLLSSIDNILAYAELDSGTLTIQREPIDVRQCVEQVLNSVREQAQEKGLQLRAELDLDVTQRIGDAACINQVLERLLHNAVKFTKTGYVCLRVSTPAALATDPAAQAVEFTVIDSGIGIDPGMLKDIFESFTQADASDARRHEGVGLGLAICSRIANRMGGELQCVSELGQGTRFTFTLNLPLQPGTGAITMLADGPVLDNQTPNKHRVLLVEDNAINQKITLLMLDKLGYAADLAEDGFEAIEFCKKQYYDVILMDLQMPNMGGLEATQALRNQQATQATPIIALTANARSSDRERCLAAGMTDFLTKPAKLDTLGNRIEKYLSVS